MNDPIGQVNTARSESAVGYPHPLGLVEYSHDYYFDNNYNDYFDNDNDYYFFFSPYNYYGGFENDSYYYDGCEGPVCLIDQPVLVEFKGPELLRSGPFLLPRFMTLLQERLSFFPHLKNIIPGRNGFGHRS